jgi:transposase
MSRFPDGHHLASWAAFCPGHKESGGKRYSGKTRKGNRWLKRTLTEAALTDTEGLVVGTAGDSVCGVLPHPPNAKARQMAIVIRHGLLGKGLTGMIMLPV